MTNPMSENDRRHPIAWILLAIILACAVAGTAYFALSQATTSKVLPGIQQKAIAQHLLSWVRHRLHQNWISGAIFLPEGRHDWGTTYAFQIVVMAKATEMEQTPALAAQVHYDDLNEGLVVVHLDSGQAYEFDTETDQFGKPEFSAAVDQGTWETVYLYVYGPIP